MVFGELEATNVGGTTFWQIVYFAKQYLPQI